MLQLANHSRDFSNELEFRASRSSGAGGQNVNKVNSKMELRFNIPNSLLLTEDEKNILMNALASKLSTDGTLIITAQTERSQLMNKEICIHKFYLLIEKTLTPRKKRKPTRPSKVAKEKRIHRKKMVSEIKQLRKKTKFDD